MRLSDARQGTVILTNHGAKEAAAVMTLALTDPEKPFAAGKPALIFACGSSRCTLAKMRTGRDLPAMTFPAVEGGRNMPPSGRSAWRR